MIIIEGNQDLSATNRVVVIGVASNFRRAKNIKRA